MGKKEEQIGLRTTSAEKSIDQRTGERRQQIAGPKNARQNELQVRLDNSPVTLGKAKISEEKVLV